MPTILEMTDVPMTNILENCDFKSILTLRKVCHSLRNFIDDSSFETDLDNIEIAISPTGFLVTCNWFHGTSAKDCTQNDLEIILEMARNSKLSCFTVITNPDNVGGLDDLEDILKNQARPLHTEQFVMEGSAVLKVLPYLDSKTLKEIFIRPVNYGTYNQNLNGIEKVMELEQFKNAMKLIISHFFLVRADLRKFLHFQSVCVKLHKTSMEELVALKEAFVTSTHMEYFQLVSRALNEIKRVFGTPFYDPRCPLGGSQWFFEIKNCKEHVLRIEWISGGLTFWKWKVNEVPQDAVVHH